MLNDKILITGAAGFIGSHLVESLIELGCKPKNLRLIILENESLENLPNLPFDIIRGDIRDTSIINKAIKNISYVFHLAARIDFDGKSYNEYKDVNVDATKFLAFAASKQKIKKFIFYSSIGVHGLPAGLGNIINFDETHKPTYTNYYGKSKWEAEKIIRFIHNKFNLPYIIIRPASVYGPKEKGPTLALYQAIKNNQFAFVGNGQNRMHYVYVKDLVDATILAALSKKTSGEYIIAGEKPVTLNELVYNISLSIDSKNSFYRIPKIIALICAYIFDIINKITGIKFPIFPSRVRTMTSTYYYNISKAKNELGYNPKINIEKGTKITGLWYLKNKLI